MKPTAALLFILTVVSYASVAAAGDIAGRAALIGEAPEPRSVKMNADPKCVEIRGAAVVPFQDVRISENGGLEDVFVHLKNPPEGEYEVPEQPVVLSQEGCLYKPRVQGIMLDQTLKIINDDDTLHNVRALAVKNRPFNLGQPPSLPPRTKTFKVVEPALRFKCDVHPWMFSTIFVLDHPFYGVSGPDGSFSIKDVPPGTYTVVAWHEKLGEQEIEIAVGEGSNEISFEFTAE